MVPFCGKVMQYRIEYYHDETIAPFTIALITKDMILTCWVRRFLLKEWNQDVHAMVLEFH